MSITLDDLTRLSDIIVTIDRYMIVTLYVTGMIGAILNIITFLQKRIRVNPCAVYFLSTSIVDLCIMNVFILMEIITTFAKPLFTTIYSTRIWCKMGNYLMFILPCLSSSYITLASFDRFCISSLNQTLRKWSRLKISCIMVISVFLLWSLFGLHIPISYDYIQSQCTIITNSATVFIIIDGFFFSLYNGAITPFLLCILGLMIYYNIQKSRRRVVTQAMSNPQHIHMIKMTLVQVVVTVILNTPYIVIYLLSFYRRFSIYSLSYYIIIIFSFIGRWFYYMNYCKTFYINTLTSGLFRKSLYQQLTRCCRGNYFARRIFPLNTNT